MVLQRQIRTTAHNWIGFLLQQNRHASDDPPIRAVLREIKHGPTADIAAAVVQADFQQGFHGIHIERAGFAALAGKRMQGAAPYCFQRIVSNHVQQWIYAAIFRQMI